METQPLTNLMAAGPLPVDEVVRIGREVANALAKAGGIHGELSPSVIEVGNEGVSVLPPAEHARYWPYASPEKILSKPMSPASDVFSLGAILFHALSGRTPFRADSLPQMKLVALADQPADLLSIRADIPREIATVIQRCLMKDPAQRYPSLGLVRDALDAATPKLDAFPGKRILIADDEPEIGRAVARIAAQVGVEADVVANGREVIDHLKSRRYAIALLDLNMPRLDGWGVLDFLRSRSDAKPGHLFVVTGFRDQSVSIADSSSVDAVLYKPVAPEELRALISACLRGGKLDFASILRTTPHRVVVSAA
ncbi:MAG TPA: response regulator [Thermoanaerobaculia bacterium]